MRSRSIGKPSRTAGALPSLGDLGSDELRGGLEELVATAEVRVLRFRDLLLVL
jgi:hypothetical protein